MMTDANELLRELRDRNINFFSGVPDSLLGPFCRELEDESFTGIHVRAANEGNGIGMAIGHHLATDEIPCVYMQNSGLGNCVNPLVSLASREVYSVPMLLIIGWRGRPGVHDEPQHVKQGPITPPLLNLLDIPYQVLSTKNSLRTTIETSISDAIANQSPSAILVPENIFNDTNLKTVHATSKNKLSREMALTKLIELMRRSDIVVSTTGKTSRELFEIRQSRGEAMSDFLTVGGMGHASSVALGIAIAKPDRRVVCFDGDGSCAMHLGAAMTTGFYSPKNLIHVVLNNKAHDSVGGQPTIVGELSFADIMRTLGYSATLSADSALSIELGWKKINDPSMCGPYLLEINVEPGARSDLGRPNKTPIENKRDLMRHIDSLR